MPTLGPKLKTQLLTSPPQFGLELLHCLHGVLGHHHQPLHQNHPGVQAQAQEHREEPEDQAEAAGAGLSGAGVGHVHQLRAEHRRGAAGSLHQRPQAFQHLHLPGPQRPARPTGRGVLLEGSILEAAAGERVMSDLCQQTITTVNQRRSWLEVQHCTHV